MNSKILQLNQKKLVLAQLLILLNCYFCFTYLYESILIYTSWLIVPVACILWLTTKPWRQFTINYLTILQSLLFVWFVVITIIHQDFSLNSQMLLSGVFLFLIMSNVFDSSKTAIQSSLFLLFAMAILSTVYSVLGLVMAQIDPTRFRFLGITVNRNHFGAFCFLGMGAIIGVYQFWGKDKSISVKLLLAGIFIINICALIYSDSRAAFLGVVTFFLFYFLLIGYRYIQNKKIYWTIFFTIIVLGSILMIWYIFHRGYTFSDTESVYAILDELSSKRFELWRAGISIIAEHPILGLSDHDYGRIIAQFRGEGMGQHNIIMGIGVYYGIPGMLMVLALIIGTVVAAVRTYKNKSTDREQKEWIIFWAAFIAALLMNDMFETYIFFLHMPNSFLFFFGTGVLAKFYQDSKKTVNYGR